MPHMAGGKISGNHTTVIEQAQSVVKALQKNPHVSKITLGNIDNRAGSGSSGTKRIKVIDKNNCLKIAVSGNSANQDLWVYLEAEKYRKQVTDDLTQHMRDEGYDVSQLDARTGR